MKMATTVTISERGRFMSVFLFFAFSLWAWPAYPQSSQETGNNQRPRRVTTTESPSSPITGATTNVTEEVGEGEVVRVDTRLVSVPATVADTSGRPLSTLRAENFELFEDGQKQTIANFSATDAPFEIALLLDTSASTQADIALIKSAAKAFIEGLHPNDRLAIIAFNTMNQGATVAARVDVLTELTANQQTLERAIQDLGSSRGTPLYDALDQIAEMFHQQRPREDVRGRQAIVALTDGVDSSSNIEFSAVRAKILAYGLACYFINVNTEDLVEDRFLKDCDDPGHLTLSAKQLQRYRRTFVPTARPEDYESFCQLGSFERMDISRQLYNLARWQMNDLAKSTGASNFEAASLSDARAAFAQLAAELGTQYSLGYYPTNKTPDGKFRLIRVQVRGVDGEPNVRAREGYYAPSL
jgi:VWFA-related protein